MTISACQIHAMNKNNHKTLIHKRTGERRNVVLNTELNLGEKSYIYAYEKCQDGNTVMPYIMSYPARDWKVE